MQRRWTVLKWAALAASAGSIILAMIMIWRASPPGLGESTSDPATKAQTQVEAPVIVERKGERIIWQLRASEARQQANGKMLLTHPELNLFTKAGEPVAVRARQGWFNPLTRDVLFEGDVKVRYQTWRLHSATLIYDSGKDELRIPGAFTLTGGSITAHGKRMRIERGRERLFVDGGIDIDDQNPKWKGSGHAKD